MATAPKEATGVITNDETMGMEDKTKDTLSGYQRKEYPRLEKRIQPAPKLVKTPEDYKAFEPFGNRRGSRFRIVDANGKSYGCSYAHLLDWIFDPPGLLTLTTSTRIYTLKGQNLRAIEKALMDEKIKELCVYSEKFHNAPPVGQPIIKELVIEEG